MILCLLPAFEITEARHSKMQELILALTQDDLEKTSTWEDVLDDIRILQEHDTDVLTTAREYLWEDFQAFATLETDSRELVAICLKEWPFPAWFSGGLSWGDIPTDIGAYMRKLECVQPVWDQMILWACEDKLNGKGLFAKGGPLYQEDT